MLTSVELFAGAGGLGLGLSLAGFRHLAVIERDRTACETIRRNQAAGHEHVKDWPLIQIDARDFDYESLRDRVDVVAGGPPCQPFSMGGKHRGHSDGRDMFPAMADAIRRLRPRAFIVENVKGLTRPTFTAYFDYIRVRLAFPEIARGADEAWQDHLFRIRQHDRFGERGLRYAVSFKVLNAADHGVPQKRERVFLIGFRCEGGMTHHPAPIDAVFPAGTHSAAALLREKWVTGEYWDRHAIPRAERGDSPGGVHEQIARHEKESRSGMAAWLTVRDALRGLPDPERHPHAARQFQNHEFQPGVKFYAGHTGSAFDLPAKTLKAGDHGVPGGENALVRSDGTGRYFSVRESARLQTFPDSYVISGSWSEAMRQLGNAVPVTLARAVANNLANILGRAELAASDQRSHARA